MCRATHNSACTGCGESDGVVVAVIVVVDDVVVDDVVVVFVVVVVGGVACVVGCPCGSGVCLILVDCYN